MRRGQIALYVVIGVVLLLLILILFLLTRSPDSDIATPEVRAVAPVSEFIASCTEVSLERLLRTAGANGGFLETNHLRRSPRAYDAEVVAFPPQVVPYWSHVKPCGNILGCEASEQPPLCKRGAPCPITVIVQNDHPSLQEQLEAALPIELEACLNDFENLQDQFEVERTGMLDVEVLFTQSGVLGTVDMPVVITELASGQRVTLTEFTGEADVDMVRLYTLAHQLADAERRTAYLERLTLHLLSVYSGVDQPLPPMRAVTLLGEENFWIRTQVEQVIAEEVLPWTSFIQVVNAMGNFVPIWPSEEKMASMTELEQQLYAGIFTYLYLNVSEEIHPELSARFFYPGTKPYLSINGGQELLKPRSADTGGLVSRIAGVFINDYRFRYDLAYPVIVTLTDAEAFDGKGLDWSFALEANIRRNKPLNRSASADDFLILDEQIDFTSPLQRVENTLLIKTRDKYTLEPLPFARVSYSCGEEYFIGESDENGELVTTLPYCRYGGVLLYSKEGYMGSGLEYDNYQEGITKSFQLELWPLRNVTLTMMKRTPAQVEELSGRTLTQALVREHRAMLNASDMVILNFKRIKETPYDEDVPFVGFFTFSVEEHVSTFDLDAKRRELEQLQAEGLLTAQDVEDWLVALNQSLNLTLSGQEPVVHAELAPGSYEIEAFLLYTEPFTIPEETRDFCADPLCLSRQEMTLNATNFTTWLNGGAMINASEPWLLSESTLYRFDEYVLYVLERELPANWHDLEEYDTPEDFLRSKRLMQMPSFE